MKTQSETILEVPAIVLANLCVSHIMISQNEEAEELMRKVSDVDSETRYLRTPSVPILLPATRTVSLLYACQYIMWHCDKRGHVVYEVCS